MRARFFRVMAAILAGMISLSVSCASQESFEASLNQIVSPYIFHLVRWELGAAGDEIRQIVAHWSQDDDVSKVEEYFAVTARINTLAPEIEAVKGDNLQDELKPLLERKLALESLVERIIERQIRDTLSRQGIYNPVDGWLRLKIGFPPVNFKLAEPPYLLVISPREKIETRKTVMLEPTITLKNIETLEAEVDKLGISSLVVKLGGVATYPAFVSDSGNLRSTLEAACEEWLHQYLVFKPLGVRYVLNLTGASPNYEITTMNETVTSMLGHELGEIVFQNYYAKSAGLSQQEQVAEGFDFNREMRDIRKTVDVYLAEGRVTTAEEFMKTKRQYLASNGYYIRKLNQAYFAFHGAYADSPTSIDPIGVELRELREKSASIKSFLDKVSQMTSREELKMSLR